MIWTSRTASHRSIVECSKEAARKAGRRLNPAHRRTAHAAEGSEVPDATIADIVRLIDLGAPITGHSSIGPRS